MQTVYDDFCRHVERKDVEGAIVADSQFHQLIAKATRNRTLSIIMKTMGETLNEGWYASLNIPGRLERTIGEHGAVLEAIQHHDADAAGTLMRTHLENALADIKKHVGTMD
jgi:GntR family transcriptional repressor for pyruvate dehydrogenase complex